MPTGFLQSERLNSWIDLSVGNMAVLGHAFPKIGNEGGIQVHG